jgi:CspA family cold shock protein
MRTGIIKKIVSEKGFGFIKVDGNHPDVFFHHSSVSNHQFDELMEGQRVEFQLDEQGAVKGPRASVVRPVSHEQRAAA